MRSGALRILSAACCALTLCLVFASCGNNKNGAGTPDGDPVRDAGPDTAVPQEEGTPQDISTHYAKQAAEDFSLALPDGMVLELAAPYAPFSGCTREYRFDGEEMYACERKRHANEDYSLIVGTDYYAAENTAQIQKFLQTRVIFDSPVPYTYFGGTDEEFINYLRTNILGAETGRGVAVGDGEETVLKAYPDHLLYIPGDEADMPGVRSDEEPPAYCDPLFDCDYVLVWQPYDDPVVTDNRDISFYIKDGTVMVIELVTPYELRYGYSPDREQSERVIAEKRAALEE